MEYALVSELFRSCAVLRPGATPHMFLWPITEPASRYLDRLRRLGSRREFVDLACRAGGAKGIFHQHIHLANRILPEANHEVVQPPVAATCDPQLADIPEPLAFGFGRGDQE